MFEYLKKLVSSIVFYGIKEPVAPGPLYGGSRAKAGEKARLWAIKQLLAMKERDKTHFYHVVETNTTMGPAALTLDELTEICHLVLGEGILVHEAHKKVTGLTLDSSRYTFKRNSFADIVLKGRHFDKMI